jgi:hypothetical protein
MRASVPLRLKQYLVAAANGPTSIMMVEYGELATREMIDSSSLVSFVLSRRLALFKIVWSSGTSIFSFDEDGTGFVVSRQIYNSVA